MFESQYRQGALLLGPKILVCDESTSALDVMTRNGIIDLLKDLMRPGHCDTLHFP
jgi:ABC-type glutathione transport system ATPase component